MTTRKVEKVEGKSRAESRGKVEGKSRGQSMHRKVEESRGDSQCICRCQRALRIKRILYSISGIESCPLLARASFGAGTTIFLAHANRDGECQSHREPIHWP